MTSMWNLAQFPEDELIENVEKKLLTYEKRLYAKQEFDTLLADNYTLIDDTGHEHNKAELIEARKRSSSIPKL